MALHHRCCNPFRRWGCQAFDVVQNGCVLADRLWRGRMAASAIHGVLIPDAFDFDRSCPATHRHCEPASARQSRTQRPRWPPLDCHAASTACNDGAPSQVSLMGTRQNLTRRKCRAEEPHWLLLPLPPALGRETAQGRREREKADNILAPRADRRWRPGLRSRRGATPATPGKHPASPPASPLPCRSRRPQRARVPPGPAGVPAPSKAHGRWPRPAPRRRRAARASR